MAKFKINKERFKKFLEITACEGIIKFRDSKAVTEPLFSCFFLVAKDNQLEVLTIDTIKKKIQLNNIISGVEIIEDGTITVSDYNSILDVLKGKGLGKGDPVISIWDEGNKIWIQGDLDKYEIRQRENKDLTAVNKKLKYLKAWRKAHEEDENGIIIASVRNKKTKEIVNDPFSTKVIVNKDDLLKVVDDTTRLTKDNLTRISLNDSVLEAFKGAGNAKTKGEHIIPYEDVGSEVIDFDKDFYSIQTIVPNLFDKIILNFRKVKGDGSIAVWIKSMDEKTKTEINIALNSKKG